MKKPPDYSGGKGWELRMDHWLDELAAVTGGALWWHANEPKMRGPIRVDGGIPDRSVAFRGHHLIECKHSSGTAARLGRLVATDKAEPSGISPAQAEQMDGATRAGVRCWIAVRLELPAATAKKLGNPAFFVGGDVPAVICRLIPWPVWRARMAAADAQSIPAVELADLGWPLRSAGELRRALTSDP